MGSLSSSISSTSSKSIWKFASSYAFCSRNNLNSFYFSSISNLSISSSPSSSEKISSSDSPSYSVGLRPAALSCALSRYQSNVLYSLLSMGTGLNISFNLKNCSIYSVLFGDRVVDSGFKAIIASKKMNSWKSRPGSPGCGSQCESGLLSLL